MLLLAHRGFWTQVSEKNTRAAFERAFDGGFGVETDIRDLDGALVISHDPPRLSDAMAFSEFLDLYTMAGCPGALALNVKADGLQLMTKQALAAHGVENAFVFDMAVPDGLGYLRHGFETFTRHSEIETVPAFYDKASGVWLDCFESDWFDESVVAGHLAVGKRVALVSPELHGRPHLGAWTKWQSFAARSEILLCTDYPQEAASFFS